MKQKFVIKLWSLSPSTEINQETLEVDAVDDLFLTSNVASDELGFQEQQRARMMICIQRRDNKEQGNTFNFKRSGKVMHKPTMGFYHAQLSRGTRSASSYEEPPLPTPADLQIRRRNPPRWPSPSAVVVHRLRSLLTVSRLPFLFASIFHSKNVFMFYFLLGKLQDAVFSEIQTSSFISFRIEQSRASPVHGESIFEANTSASTSSAGSDAAFEKLHFYSMVGGALPNFVTAMHALLKVNNSST